MTIELVAAWGGGLSTHSGVKIQAPSLRMIDRDLPDATVETLMATVKARQPDTCRLGVGSHKPN